jgi:uncharacterized protein (DUF1330 family)
MIVVGSGRVLWAAAATYTVVAPPGERWDDVLLVEYPSRQAFLEMVDRHDYQTAAVHRTAALEDSRLIATRPNSGLGSR